MYCGLAGPSSSSLVWGSRGLAGLGALDLDSLARAIFRQEGVLDANGNWVTSSLGYRNNNPGNMIYAGQKGAHPSSGYDPDMGAYQTYAVFDTLQDGIDATKRQLALDSSRGLTLAQRLSTWATGNRSAYVSNVSGWLGVDPSTPLSAFTGGSAALPAGAAAAGLSWSLPAFLDDFGSESVTDGQETGLSGAAKVGIGLALASLLVLAAVD